MKFLSFLILSAALLSLSGCNTVKGLGEDISGSASWTQEKISGDSTPSSSRSSDAQYVQNPPQFQKAN